MSELNPITNLNMSNASKIVEITRTNTDSGNIKLGSWRDLLYNLVTDPSNEEDLNSSNSISYSKSTILNAPCKIFNFDNSNLENLKVNSNVHLLMDKELPSLKSNNNYTSAVESFFSNKNKKTGSLEKTLYNVEKGVALVSNIASAIGLADEEDLTSASWHPWMKDVPAWSGNKSTLDFSYTFNFKLGQYGLWNAYKEVVLPIMNLMIPTLPQYIDDLYMHGPAPNAISLLARGISTAINGISKLTDVGGLGDVLASLIDKTYKSYTYTVKFGNIFTCYNMLIKDSSVIFDKETDQSGWPISGSITLQFMGVTPMSIASNRTVARAIRFGEEK